MPRFPITNDWTIELSEGFTRSPEHGDIVFRNGECSVYASIYQAPSAEAENAISLMLQEREAKPERVFERNELGVKGRAYLLPEGEGTESYWGLNTWTTNGASLACVTFYFTDADDAEWAVKAWRSLQQGPVKTSYVN
jgi:hypothetical protein